MSTGMQGVADLYHLCPGQVVEYIAALEAEIAKLRKVVEVVAKCDPMKIDRSSYDFPQDHECVFCGSMHREPDGHWPTCAWLLARKLTGGAT